MFPTKSYTPAETIKEYIFSINSYLISSTSTSKNTLSLLNNLKFRTEMQKRYPDLKLPQPAVTIEPSSLVSTGAEATTSHPTVDLLKTTYLGLATPWLNAASKIFTEDADSATVIATLRTRAAGKKKGASHNTLRALGLIDRAPTTP